MEPIVTSSSALRVFYGTTTLSVDASVFSGVVVHGTDLVFDPETGFPVGGTIDRIEPQTRSDIDGNTVLAVYDNIDAEVSQLDNAFSDTATPWYDPANFFSSDFMQAAGITTWKGGAGNDDMTGSDRSDLMRGGDGDDTVYGGEGRDYILVGSGDDLIDGGAEKDELRGGDCDDMIYGGDANDIIHGDSGEDMLFGGTGDDVMHGDDGDDRMTGSSGNDVLIGGAGNDQMRGGEGNDQAAGGSRNDIFVADMTSEDGGHMTVRDFTQGEDALYLDTGDILTADELFTIFSADATQTGKHVVYDNGDGNIMTLLHTNLEDLSADDFYDIDTEAEEEDMLLGFL